MNKVVINHSYGGFGLSYEATRWLAERGNSEAKAFLAECSEEDFWAFDPDLERHDPLLIECVETLGEAAREDADTCTLKIRTIEGDRYIIESHDGWETVVEPRHIAWVKVTS